MSHAGSQPNRSSRVANNRYRNVTADGAAEVRIARRRFQPAARELDEDRAVEVPADYQPRHRIVGFVVRRVLSHLLGWRYIGTNADRRHAVRQLPILGLRPAPTHLAAVEEARPRS